MNSSESSLIGRAEHGDTKAIIELLKKHSFPEKLKVYWVWQALVHSAPMSDIPDGDLHEVLCSLARAKRNNNLNAADTKIFLTFAQQYTSLHHGRACVMMYYGAPDEQDERQWLEAGCRAKSRFCAKRLEELLKHEVGGKLKAADLCLDASTWPFDDVSDDDKYNDAELKTRGCNYILDYLHCNEMVTLKYATPLLLKVYQNGNAEQKKESAKDLEKRTFDLLNDQFSWAETLARRGSYKDAVDVCAEILNKKDELSSPLLQHDRIDKFFTQVALAQRKYEEEALIVQRKREEEALIVQRKREEEALIAQRKREEEERVKKEVALLNDNFFKAKSLAQLGEYKEAAAVCAECLKEKEGLPRAIRNHARVDALFKQLESAQAEYLASIRNHLIYIVLAILFGCFGAHDFYVGSPQKGKCKLLLSLLSLGTLAPVAWLMGMSQVLRLKANLGCPVQQRKNAKHERMDVTLNVVLYITMLVGILVCIRLECCGTIKEGATVPSHPDAKGTSGFNSGKKATTESRGSTAETISLGGVAADHSKDNTLNDFGKSASYPGKQTATESCLKGEAVAIQESNPATSKGTSNEETQKEVSNSKDISDPHSSSRLYGVHLQQELLDAVMKSKVDKVDDLLSKGANANAITGERKKGLVHLATDRNSLAIVKRLVAANADVNIRNDEKRTALYSAIYHQNAEMVEFLISSGALTKIEDKWGITPLEFAKERGCSNRILNLLKKKK